METIGLLNLPLQPNFNFSNYSLLTSFPHDVSGFSFVFQITLKALCSQLWILGNHKGFNSDRHRNNHSKRYIFKFRIKGHKNKEEKYQKLMKLTQLY